ncbi:unnamed protein product [Calicophoron daubneyi]|uniref:Uncharacterized protein n=1 Tax=Calicophoron daubneyi TaxID=300641 RepID=A0AAV2TV44_CALDB
MGQAAGKLVISHPNTKTKDTAENLDANGTDTQAENAPQTDKENDKTETHLNGASDHVDEAATGPNGKVNGVEGETTDEEKKDSKTPKKTKNPITWIQRRLSKRNSTTKKQPVDETPAEGDTGHVDEHPAEDVASHPVEVSESEVKQVAEALVDEAISSAVTSGNEQVPQPEAENAPHVTETPESKISDVSDHQPHVEAIEKKHEAAVVIENNVPEVAVDILTNSTTEVNGHPVVDTNNTNAENDCCQEKNVTLKEQDEVVAKKLANLEITNGHMENEEVLVNGDSTA